MKIQIISDIHLDSREFKASGLPPTLADVLVVAGDVGRADRLGIFFEKACARWMDVIFVPGNHEYYGSRSMGSVMRTLHEIAERFGNLHILDNAVVTVRGHRFVGSTLWSDPKLCTWHDYDKIADWTPSANHKCKKFLEKTVQKGDVVVTHFMPIMAQHLRQTGVPYMYVNPMDDDYYGNEGMDHVVERAKVWVSGHTHQAFDTKVGGCRWVCNPIGNPGEHTGADERGLLLEL